MNPATKELNKIPTYIWSNTESGDRCAWLWYDGSYGGNHGKYLTSAAVPFFAINKK